jgi:hypothetical protein
VGGMGRNGERGIDVIRKNDWKRAKEFHRLIMVGYLKWLTSIQCLLYFSVRNKFP